MNDRIDKLKAFLADSPADCFLKHALALEYIKLGKEEEARQLFEDILHQNPQYTGSYYHLAKLLERTGKTEEAMVVYEKGMEVCKSLGEQHAFGELRAAYEELIY